MNFHIRAATLADIRQMVELAGPPVTRDSLAEWFDGDSAYAAWHLVEDDAGRALGFQHIGRSDALPPEACEIATFFTRTEKLPAGAGARLFDTSAEAARLLRYTWISAAIGQTNEAARVYYQALGFRPYDADATRQHLRFDLD
ncbi:MAG: GNAT family N-acetyltransferase [Maritimibacter sp.]|nr:GNAT family N-acetyltransferase [Maritimibacter sp.]